MSVIRKLGGFERTRWLGTVGIVGYDWSCTNDAPQSQTQSYRPARSALIFHSRTPLEFHVHLRIAVPCHGFAISLDHSDKWSDLMKIAVLVLGVKPSYYLVYHINIFGLYNCMLEFYLITILRAFMVCSFVKVVKYFAM